MKKFKRQFTRDEKIDYFINKCDELKTSIAELLGTGKHKLACEILMKNLQFFVSRVEILQSEDYQDFNESITKEVRSKKSSKIS